MGGLRHDTRAVVRARGLSEPPSYVWRIVRYAPEGVEEQRFTSSEMDERACRQFLVDTVHAPVEDLDVMAARVANATPRMVFAAGADIRMVATLWTIEDIGALDIELAAVMRQVSDLRDAD